MLAQMIASLIIWYWLIITKKMHPYLVDLIELLYQYKLSFFFELHLALVILVGIAFLAVSVNLHEETTSHMEEP